MKKTKYVMVIIVSVLIVLGIIIIYKGNSFNTNNNATLYRGLPVSYSETMMEYDTSTTEKAIGVSDYVFVAKINKILRTEYLNPMKVETGFGKTETVSNPYTIYEIEVVQNIKGNLITDTPIEFMQYGGLNENKKSYTFLKDGSLLTENDYYIIMCNTFGDEGAIEMGDPKRMISLGNTYDENAITPYQEAYKNQVVPEKLLNAETNISKYDVKYDKN